MEKVLKNKLVAGVGINDANYRVTKYSKTINGKKNRVWVCPYYSTWSNMLNRCYRPNKRLLSYGDTKVCEEWLKFSNFKCWMERQEWENNDLDKDLLTDNNIYSDRTCIFIPREMNMFLTSESINSQTGLSGIYINNGAYTCNVYNKNKNLISKTFLCVEDAINFSAEQKLYLANELYRDSHLYFTLVRFIIRRRYKMLDLVKQNSENFPKRVHPLMECCMPVVGDSFVLKSGRQIRVISVINTENIIIEFENGYRRRVSNARINSGYIRYKQDVEFS